MAFLWWGEGDGQSSPYESEMHAFMSLISIKWSLRHFYGMGVEGWGTGGGVPDKWDKIKQKQRDFWQNYSDLGQNIASTI